MLLLMDRCLNLIIQITALVDKNAVSKLVHLSTINSKNNSPKYYVDEAHNTV